MCVNRRKIPYNRRYFHGYEPFKRQPHKMVKHTQNNSSAFADKLFVCLTILWGWRLKS